MQKSPLWIERYPGVFGGAEQQKLRTLGGLLDMPHLLFYGPPGCGKRTRANQLVGYMYGPDTTVLAEGRIEIEPAGRDYVAVYKYLYSKYHLVIEGSEYATQESVEALERLISTVTLEKLNNSPKPFVVLIITESHLLGSGVQAALRRIVELYSQHCRIIFLTTFLSSILPALQSRSFLYRCPKITFDVCFSILNQIWIKETGQLVVANSTKTMIKDILNDTNCNLKLSILDLQTRKMLESRSPSVSEATNSQKLSIDSELRAPEETQPVLEPEAVVSKTLEKFEEMMNLGFPDPYQVGQLIIDTPQQYHSGLWRRVMDLLASGLKKHKNESHQTLMLQQYLQEVARGGHPISEAVYLLTIEPKKIISRKPL